MGPPSTTPPAAPGHRTRGGRLERTDGARAGVDFSTGAGEELRTVKRSV